MFCNMNRNFVFSLLLCTAFLAGCAPKTEKGTAKSDRPENAAERILLKDYAPVSIFNIPVTEVDKAAFPVIDAHSHDYAATPEEIERWVAVMDSCGIKRTNLLHCEWIGEPFEVMVKKYSAYPDRFSVWCCLDYTDIDKPGWSERAIADLERKHAMGAVGIGEMVDKGLGDLYARPVKGYGIRLDDSRLQPVLQRAGELGMPVNIHLAEPIWMYEPADNRNDGLMNGATWQVDTTAEGCIGYDRIMEAFERAVAANPKTTFIACHYMNMTHDYVRLGALLDKYPNLYLDMAARVAESAVVPRATRRFLIKYSDRVLFGTDNGMTSKMYRMIFRVLETDDEHIYEPDFGYHWSFSGLDLPRDVLKKLYYDNASKILRQ